MMDDLAHVDTVFFTQNDFYRNILKFVTPYGEHSHKLRKLQNLQNYMPEKHLSN